MAIERFKKIANDNGEEREKITLPKIREVQKLLLVGSSSILLSKMSCNRSDFLVCLKKKGN